MSEANDRVSMDELARLIGGPTGSMPAIAQRLMEYESKDIVKPELRKVPMVLPFTVVSFSAPNVFGGRATGTRPHDAWYEDRRSAALPAPRPVREPLVLDVRFYGRDDAKAIAPHERTNDCPAAVGILPLCMGQRS